MMEARIATQRLWVTADYGTVVAEGDPRAAFLLAGAGCPIPATMQTGDGPVDIVVPDEFLVDTPAGDDAAADAEAPADDTPDEATDDTDPESDPEPELEKVEEAVTSKRGGARAAKG